MYRVLISDPLDVEGLTILEQASDIELDRRSGLKGAELRAALGECDGVIVRSGTTLTEELVRGQTRLRAIVRAGVGVDNIDVPAATRAGIVVMNTPGGNTLSTAEHTIALMMSMCRFIPAADASVRSGKWDRKSYVGAQLAGRSIGVVGLGRVGQGVAKRAIGLEMKVLGYDPFLTPERAKQLGIESVASLDELLPNVDILTIHVPLSDDTKSLIGADRLRIMRKGSYIVNCARGGIVDEQALYEALKSKHLAGAALDVFSAEPPGKLPLFDLPNVVVTPHLGASTTEAQRNVAIEAAQLMRDFLTTGKVRFAVNLSPMEAAETGEMARHLDISFRLGILQAQLAEGRIRGAVVEYRGEATKLDTKLITAAFTRGLLQPKLEEQVNLVNAPLLASERGIVIREESSNEPSDFHTLIRTEVETDRDKYVASGTTRGSQYNRLVRLGEYRLDAFLDGIMLIYRHQDKPGLIGFVGTILGRHQVNIAQMMNGRKTPGGLAIGVLALDSLPPEAALAEIRNHEHIASVQVVRLPPIEEHRSLGG